MTRFVTKMIQETALNDTDAKLARLAKAAETKKPVSLPIPEWEKRGE